MEEDRKKREEKYQELLKKSAEATKQYQYKIKEIIDKRNKEDEALIKKNNQNISWNKQNLDRFVIDNTEKLNGSTIYHESYGEGKFEFLEKGNNGYVYIHINFQGYGDKKFIYKGELPNVLSLEMPKSLQSNLRVEKARFEFENKQEEEFFNKVSKHVAEQLDVARYHEQLAGYDFNDFTDSYNENIYDDMTKLHENVSELSAIARSPYFARIDYNQQSPCTLYFGKRAVQGYVTDWRDKRAIMYYQYKLFIDNKDINLSLVRDINIVSGIYRGFNDKFSSKEIMQKGDQVEKIIADDFLIQIIENERASHRIHDIVESIQKKTI